ncbi:biosynthetic-type acetolactate synthase large subunit [Pyrobaculum aerophilum]|uniref:Acetolactate synthase n=1 Tax=Pyrobaculum aerophilum TaxID=13773 RepID=A0A371R401_9CREN|nr:biosynthetic-type acetolactate synthase large subunit [Pyrobaculum aerophilum]RFA98538.1 acetolactate synthase, large subunit, biosynthetic type [Pyrobaculum aerophilum]RFA99242.1 acetolactate synthase, large subunit, biosynthetic type [Pyrobaculum aerophilum]
MVETFKQYKVKHVLGIPGGQIMPLFDALYGQDIETILFRHEQGAIHAAEGYARVSGRPAVVAVTSGPGATNLVTGITDAYMDSTPVVAITGQVVTSVFGRDGFQETDILGVVTPVTKFTYQVKKPSEATSAFKTAYEISIIGRPGPTLIDLPRDIQLAPAPDYEEKIIVNREKFIPPPPDEDKLRLAAKYLIEAKRPVILVGGGVLWSGATPEVLEVSRLLNAPIVSTLPGKTAVPHDYPLYMGPAGMHGRVEADAALANADVILAVGTRFSDRTWGRFKELIENVTSGKLKLIHIDIDKSEIGKNVKPTVGIVGDAKIALRKLIDYIQPGVIQNNKYISWLLNIRKMYDEAMSKIANSTPGFHPWKALKVIRNAAPRNTVTVTGVGSHQMWAEIAWDVYEPGSFITSAGLGTMGFCVPAALGAKLADRSRPVLCIDGDGSFQMTMNNLALVRDYNLPIVVTIFDNRALQLVKQWQVYLYKRRIIATEFSPRPDFLKIAEAYDIEGVRPESYEELERVVSRALKNDEPLIVDLTIDSEYDIVLPWVKPGDWLTSVIMPEGMHVQLTYED